MYKRREKNKFYILRVWLCVLLAISILLTFTYIKMQPIILRYAESVAETVMLNSANQAIVNILDNNGIEYNDIVILNRDTNGYVTSLETDIYKTNYLKSNISNKISSIIAQKERYIVAIPIGTFFANTYTSGLGPDVKFKMQITTTAFVDFSDKFRAAGINQVLHSINVDIKINGSIIIAGYKKHINVSTSAMVAQTVITGVVPDAFTSVIETEEDNTGGLINDYGALS